MIDRAPSPCPNCAATGFCPCCKGDGLMLDEYVVDVCPKCNGHGQVGAKGERSWCRRCGGNGTELMYKQLVPCPECIGDGSCMVCVGKGRVDE